MANENDRTESVGQDQSAHRGALTGGGAIELIVTVTENPTVAATIGGAVGGAVTGKLLGRPKEPLPPDPPHSGLWVPPSADE